MLTMGLWWEQRGGGWDGKLWVFGCKFNHWHCLITQLQFEPHAGTHMTQQDLDRPWLKRQRVLKEMKQVKPLHKKTVCSSHTHLHTHRREKERRPLSMRMFRFCRLFMSPIPSGNQGANPNTFVYLRHVCAAKDDWWCSSQRGGGQREWEREIEREIAAAYGHSRWNFSDT